MNDRILYIDYLKGICILSVVMLHVNYIYFTPSGGIVNIIADVFQMPMFFFLSGLFIMGTIRKYRKIRVITDKSSMLLIPFFVVGGVFSQVSRNDFYFFLGDSLHLGYWFLLVLLEFIFIVLLITFIQDHIFKTDNLFVKLLLYLAAYVVIITGYKTGGVLSSIFSLHQTFRLYPMYILGVLYSENKQVYRIIHSQWTITLAWVVGILFFYLFYNIQSLLVYQFLFRLSGVIILFNVAKSYSDQLFMEKFICYIGKKSMLIYVLHFFFVLGLPHINVETILSNLPLQLLFSTVLSLVIIVNILIISPIVDNSLLLRLLVIGKLPIRRS